MSPLEVPWTRVGEGEGSLPGVPFAPLQKNGIVLAITAFEGSAENTVSAYAGEAGRSSCQSTVPGNRHMQVSQRQTATRSIIIIRPEHPEKHIHGFVVGRMSTCNTFVLEHVMYHRNTAGRVFSSEQSSDLANRTTPDRLDRQ